MFTTDITTVKASKIRGKFLKWKVVAHFVQDEIIDLCDPINLPVYHERETLKHFRNYDEETQKKVMNFYYDYVQGWTDGRDGTLTIKNSVAYIKSNLGLE